MWCRRLRHGQHFVPTGVAPNERGKVLPIELRHRRFVASAERVERFGNLDGKPLDLMGNDAHDAWETTALPRGCIFPPGRRPSE